MPRARSPWSARILLRWRHSSVANATGIPDRAKTADTNIDVTTDKRLHCRRVKQARFNKTRNGWTMSWLGIFVGVRDFNLILVLSLSLSLSS